MFLAIIPSIKGVVPMERAVKVNITPENGEMLQELIIKLAVIGGVNQDEAREIFRKAEEIKKGRKCTYKII